MIAAVRWAVGVVTVASFLGAVPSCSSSNPEQAAANPPQPAPQTQSDKATERLRPADLASAVEDLRGRYGIAVVPVGADTVTSAGTWSSGWAWTTIKVPVSVAAVRDDDGEPTTATTKLMRDAVTRSDNDAARTLYRRLGGGQASTDAVEAVLRDAGDRSTQLDPVWIGTTSWALADQAVFAAGLPCVEGSAPVLKFMGQVIDEQRWGLGELGGRARFKGGWGQNAAGRHLVRQMGVVQLPDGSAVGVALAGEPLDGSYETATADLSRMARWLGTKLDELPGGRCADSRTDPGTRDSAESTMKP